MEQQQQQQKINPFYISKSISPQDDWNDWSEDEEEDYFLEERRGLVHSEHGEALDHNYYPPHRNDKYTYPHRRNKGNLPDNSSGIKIAVFLSLVFLIFLIATGGNHSKGGEISLSAGQQHHSSDNNIQHLVVLGERHSGVPWMKNKLKECYPRIHVSTILQREGYLFQEDGSTQKHPSVVVHMVLNVYDWLEQVRHFPEYMPRHRIARDATTGRVTPLPWKDFVTTPWTMDRPQRDMDAQHNNTLVVCQGNFSYHRVISCIEDVNAGKDNPIYELQEDGTPFTNILELRAAKLRNHHDYVGSSSFAMVQQVYTVQQERLQQEFENLLDKIESTTQWERSCSVNILPPSLSLTEDMTQEFVAYLGDHVDWTAEDLVGYQPWTSVELSKYDIPSEEATTKASDDAGTADDASADDDETKNATSDGNRHEPNTDEDGPLDPTSAEKKDQDSEMKSDSSDEATASPTSDDIVGTEHSASNDASDDNGAVAGSASSEFEEESTDSPTPSPIHPEATAENQTESEDSDESEEKEGEKRS